MEELSGNDEKCWEFQTLKFFANFISYSLCDFVILLPSLFNSLVSNFLDIFAKKTVVGQTCLLTHKLYKLTPILLL